MVFGDGGFAWTALDIAEEIEETKKDPSRPYKNYFPTAEKGIACYFVI